jgi:hypothetical protein
MKASAQELVSEGLRDLGHGTAKGNAHAVNVLNQALDVDSGLARLTPRWRRLTSSGPELIDGERIEGGDQGYMPHIDLAAVQAIRGETRDACRSLRAAIQAGWRGRALATRSSKTRAKTANSDR